MSISRIKQIKRILKDQDVRDPRITLGAIERVLAQPKADTPKPILTLTLTRTDKRTLAVVIKSNSEVLEAKHVVAAMESLDEFGQENFGQCDDPDCPVHGAEAKRTTAEPLKEALNKIRKGNLQ